MEEATRLPNSGRDRLQRPGLRRYPFPEAELYRSLTPPPNQMPLVHIHEKDTARHRIELEDDSDMAHIAQNHSAERADHAHMVDTLLEKYGDELLQVYRDPEKDILEYLHQLLLELNQ